MTEKIHDGGWWSTERPVEYACPRCGGAVRDWPTVMRYREDLDVTGSGRTAPPSWPIDGWLVWWECGRCGWQDFASTATAEQVAKWTGEYGPWAEVKG